MMIARPLIVGMMVAIATGASAFPRDPYANCPSQMAKEVFESQGGKLVIIKQPDMAFIPQSFLKSCQGSTRFSVVVLADGSIGFGPDPKFFPEKAKSPHDAVEATFRCTFALMHRIEKMRYMPPRLRGKSVCLEFHAQWSSRRPHEFMP
jgi:hypothetical protein